MEEIKAGDIMIGNYIRDVWSPNGFFKVTQLKKYSAVYGKDFTALYENLRPIPLTEDILLKAGFEKLPHMTVTNSMMLDIGRGRYISIGDIDNCNQMMWLQSIDGKKVTDLICLHNYDYDGWLYVHKLQNIVKSLTGNDLKIEV